MRILGCFRTWFSVTEIVAMMRMGYCHGLVIGTETDEDRSSSKASERATGVSLGSRNEGRSG